MGPVAPSHRGGSVEAGEELRRAGVVCTDFFKLRSRPLLCERNCKTTSLPCCIRPCAKNISVNAANKCIVFAWRVLLQGCVPGAPCVHFYEYDERD